MLNEDDKFAVAVYEELGIDGKKIVGHLPMEFCILFYREWWCNFLQSDWKKEALERPTRRNGYSVQHVKNLMRSLLQRKSRFFEDMDFVFSCMCCKLGTI